MANIYFEDRAYEMFGRFLDMIENTTLEIKRMNDLKEQEIKCRTKLNELIKDYNHSYWVKYQRGTKIIKV